MRLHEPDGYDLPPRLDPVLREIDRHTGLGADLLTRLVDAGAYTRRVVEAPSGWFGGDAVILTATRDRRPDALAVDSWAAHLGGDLGRYPVDCTQSAMMRPEPLAVIGPVAAAELARVDQAGVKGYAAA